MKSVRAACVVVCLFSFCQKLQAFSAGPPANRDGVAGTFCTACHRTNDLNSGPGSVVVTGFPSALTPGQIYTLQVTVSHPTQRRWGFQMSAVGPNGDQAGDFLIGGDGRTQLITGDVNGKSLQFIEHTSLGATIDGPNVFQFTYRAPADASAGTIRFNLAGNAANGNAANTGDFIYAIEFTLPIVAASSERGFTLVTRGTSSFGTAGGAAGSLSVGFGRMQTSSGTAGAGAAFIGYRPGGVLVTEVGLSAASPIRTGRIFADVGTSVNTGLALVNPTNQSALISFSFGDDSGAIFGISSFTLGPNSQIAAYLNQAPFSSASPARPVSDARTFTFDSSVAISAIAVRVRTNERGDLIISSLPVANAASTAASNTSLPHMADGGGWATEVLLVNAGDTTETGKIQFMTSAGQAMSLSVEGQTGDQFTYSIPARSSRRFRTAGTAASTTTGWVEVVPSGGTRTPAAAAVLSTRSNNVMFNETTFDASSPANAFRVFADASGNYGARQAGSLQTGAVISNAGTSAVTVTIEATNTSGVVAGSLTASIPARGQRVVMLSDIPGATVPFTGTMWVSAPSGSTISVDGFRARFNERSTPDSLVTGFSGFDEAQVSAGDLLFPQVVDSAGFTTQFALIGVRGGQSSGSVQFNTQSGTAMRLTVR